jgi:hypothetical protein
MLPHPEEGQTTKAEEAVVVAAEDAVEVED